MGLYTIKLICHKKTHYILRIHFEGKNKTLAFFYDVNMGPHGIKKFKPYSPYTNRSQNFSNLSWMFLPMVLTTPLPHQTIFYKSQPNFISWIIFSAVLAKLRLGLLKFENSMDFSRFKVEMGSIGSEDFKTLLDPIEATRFQTCPDFFSQWSSPNETGGFWIFFTFRF